MLLDRRVHSGLVPFREFRNPNIIKSPPKLMRGETVEALVALVWHNQRAHLRPRPQTREEREGARTPLSTRRNGTDCLDL